MRLHARLVRGLALLVLAAGSLSACSGGKDPDAPHLAGIQVLPASAEPIAVPAGLTVRFTALGTFSDATKRDVTEEVLWSSAATEVATVSNAAGSAGTATALAAGTTDVVATDPASGATSRATLQVLDAQLVELAIAPVEPTILVGTALQMQANAILTDDTGADLAASVTWTSSDPAIATVTQNGLVTAVAVGAATVTASDSASGVSSSTTVSVTALPAALSYLSLSRGSVVGGGSVEITGTVMLTSAPTELVLVSLSSSDPAVASVPESVAVPPGAQSASFLVATSPVDHRTPVFLTATSGDVSKTAKLNVRVPR